MAKKNPSLFLIIFFGLIFLGLGFFYLQSQSDEDSASEQQERPEAISSAGLETEEDTEAGTDIDVETAQDEGQTSSSDSTPPETSVAANSSTTSIDVQAAISERILGNPAAPIKISEHSSLTCGHCGAFHQNTFKAFKERFIDTGRAYLVFSDFPLNAPALHASMAARCVPQDQYFDFLQDLFETQDEWAYEANYLNILQKKSQEYGLGAASFKACLDSKEIQDGIVNRVRAAQAQWQISSTPSLVINNKTVISGALSIEDLETKIEEALAAQNAESTATETE